MTNYLDRIICGDCLDVMRGMPDGCVDLTVTSPPYDNLRTYNGYVFDFENIAKELYRVTKSGGVVVWVVNDATIKGSETGTSFRQALYFKDVCGFNLHDTMIWEKTGCGALGSQKCYAQNFEYMFIFTKGKPVTINILQDRLNKRRNGRVLTNGSINKNGDFKTRVIELKPFGKRTNIWNINPIKNSQHPAPFPESLASDHIVSWSNPGDVVLDPFCGSGTTCKMALKNGRNYIGIEISDEYCDIARRRVAEATPSLFKEVGV